MSGDCHRSFACHTHRCSGRREGAGGEDREESKGAEKVKESASEEETMERRKVSSTEKKIRRAQKDGEQVLFFSSEAYYF